MLRVQKQHPGVYLCVYCFTDRKMLRVQKRNSVIQNTSNRFTDRKMLRVQKQTIALNNPNYCFTDRKMLRVQKPQIKNYYFLAYKLCLLFLKIRQSSRIKIGTFCICKLFKVVSKISYLES